MCIALHSYLHFTNPPFFSVLRLSTKNLSQTINRSSKTTFLGSMAPHRDIQEKGKNVYHRDGPAGVRWELEKRGFDSLGL